MSEFLKESKWVPKGVFLYYIKLNSDAMRTLALTCVCERGWKGYCWCVTGRNF